MGCWRLSSFLTEREGLPSRGQTEGDDAEPRGGHPEMLGLLPQTSELVGLGNGSALKLRVWEAPLR